MSRRHARSSPPRSKRSCCALVRHAATGAGSASVSSSPRRGLRLSSECVAAARAEAPGHGGLHGVGMRRDVGYVVDVGSPAFVRALDDAVTAARDAGVTAFDGMLVGPSAIAFVKGDPVEAAARSISPDPR